MKDNKKYNEIRKSRRIKKDDYIKDLEKRKKIFKKIYD